MPKHNHTASIAIASNGLHKHGIRSSIKDSSDGVTLPNKGVGNNDGWWDKYCANAGTHNHTATANIAQTGANSPHENMPPYISVYVFKRTA